MKLQARENHGNHAINRDAKTKFSYNFRITNFEKVQSLIYSSFCCYLEISHKIGNVKKFCFMLKFRNSSVHVMQYIWISVYRLNYLVDDSSMTNHLCLFPQSSPAIRPRRGSDPIPASLFPTHLWIHSRPHPCQISYTQSLLIISLSHEIHQYILI